MSSGSYSQQNGADDEDGWEVASSRKSRSQTWSNSSPSANRPRVGASSNVSQQDRSGNGAWKGKAGVNGDVQKPNRWANPISDREQAYKPTAWKEAAKLQPRNENVDSRTPKNDGKGLVDGRMNQAWQSNVKPPAESWESAYVKTGRQDAVVPPPLPNGWQWGSRSGAGNNSNSGETPGSGNVLGQGTDDSGEISVSGGKVLSTLLPFEQSGEPSHETTGASYQSSGNSELENLESDDDFMNSDDYDSEASDVSHGTLKNNKWFKSFFQSLDGLTVDEINEPERQWHCPACKGGVGAIDWYRGMQPILAHAKTKRSKRVKLHRKLAELLEEELRRRGAACVIAEEMFGKWKGLRDTVNNQEIVWPPIVIIQNTILDQGDCEQWIGMGNKELLEYFKGYKAMKARHAYGPKGHRGMSVLIFEDSAMGYLEAERLHRHFLKEGRGKDDWERRRVLFHPGGKRVLYGYLATKEEMEIFNRHSKGKSKLRYDMRSYQSMVVEPMRQMDEDNQNLIGLKTKVAKVQEHSKTLEETVSIVARKLRMREDEIKIIRQRATEQHEECKKEMDCLEQSYRQQIDQLYEDVSRREQELEKMHEEFKIAHLDRCQQLEVDSVKIPKDTKVVNDKQQEEQIKIEEEIARRTTIVEISFKDSEEYERERQELIKEHDKRRKEAKLRQLQEEVAFEKELEQERVELLEKYAKRRQEAEYTVG
eukprot:Gb_06157 [translate_table: standard]